MQLFDIEKLVLSAEDWTLVTSAFGTAVAKPERPTWLQRRWKALLYAAPASRAASEQEVLHDFVARSRYLKRPAYDLWPALSMHGFTSEQIGALAALAIN